jgi:hypothetical protein
MKDQNINFTGSVHQTATKRDGQNKREEEPSESCGQTRRDFIKKPLALAVGSIVVPSFLGSLVTRAKADGNGNQVTVAPRYYPFKTLQAGDR